jgi:acetyl-CoA carboxylase biotin carboxyl carrier protein
MNAKEIKDLIEFLIEKDIAEFELERGDVKMRMKRGTSAPVMVAATAPVYTPAPVPAPVAVPVRVVEAKVSTPAAEEAEEAGLHVVRSPIVGTFYESPSPGAPPFVKPGDAVEVGTPLGIIEAMKLMNEIESDASGTVVKRHVENGQPVEYGQPLFSVRPS